MMGNYLVQAVAQKKIYWDQIVKLFDAQNFL